MTNKIPKKIHYVWMGGKPKPTVIRHCIKSWKKHLKDFEIIEWNETNFDFSKHPFVKRAYDNKEWAFVSDYIRAWVIYHHGGVYFDTDIICIKNVTPLLKDRAFVGYEDPSHPFTAVFGAEPKHPFVKKILDYYNQKGGNIKYLFNDNNTISNSEILIKEYGCKLGNIEQNLRTNIHVYPDYILCNPSQESYTVHLFYGGWTKSGKNFNNIKRELLRGYVLDSASKLKIYGKLKGKHDK